MTIKKKPSSQQKHPPQPLSGGRAKTSANLKKKAKTENRSKNLPRKSSQTLSGRSSRIPSQKTGKKDFPDKVNFDLNAFERKKGILNALLNGSEEIISLIDREYRFHGFNDAYIETIKTLYGTRPEIGKSLLDSYPKSQNKKDAKELLDRALAGETVKVDVIRGDISGHQRKFRATYLPILDQAGKVIGEITRARDITELWKMDRERAHMEEMLETFSLRENCVLTNFPVSVKR